MSCSATNLKSERLVREAAASALMVIFGHGYLSTAFNIRWQVRLGQMEKKKKKEMLDFLDF